MAAIGTVVNILGENAASVVHSDGQQVALRLNDTLQPGDTIVTPRGVAIELMLQNGHKILIAAEQVVKLTPELVDYITPTAEESAVETATIDAIVKAIEDGRDIDSVLEETAAGLSGGSASAYGHGFVNLSRIALALDAFDFEFARDAAHQRDLRAFTDDTPEGEAAAGAGAGGEAGHVNSSPSIADATVSLDENIAAGSVVTDVNDSFTGSDLDRDGDAISYSITAGNDDGIFAIDAATGEITIAAGKTLDYETATSHSLTVMASDGVLSDTATITVNVNNLNDNPVLLSDSDAAANTVAEDAAVGATVGITALGTDADAGTTVSYSLDDDAGGLFAIDAATGVVTVAGALDYETATSHSITVRATSSDGSTATENFTINVTNVNEAPIGFADSFTVAEGTTAVLGNVLANDTDVDSPILTVGQFAVDASGAGAVSANGTNSITTALGGAVVMNADGTFTYIAPVRDHGDATPDIDSFAYRASDGSLNSAWTTVSINVTDSAPIANDDVNSLSGGGSISGNVITGAGDSVGGGADVLGADGATLTSVAFNGTTYSVGVGGATINTGTGELTINQDGSYSYVPNSPVVSGSSPGNNTTGWGAFNLYGRDNGSSPFDNGTANGASSGIQNFLANLPTQGVNVTYRIEGLGVENGQTGSTSNKADRQIDNKEYLIIDLKAEANSVSFTANLLNNNRSAKWFAFDEDGDLVGSGNATNTSGTNNTAVNVTASVANGLLSDSAQYLVFAYGNGSGSLQGNNFRIDDVSAVLDVDPVQFTYTLTDADGSTSSATLTINPGNAPVIDLDASAAGTGYTTLYTQGGSAVAIADTDISITDADSTHITKATITLTNMQAGDVLAVGGLPPGITASVVGNVVTLSGSATLAAYQTAIQSVTFSTSSADTTPRSIDVVVTDGTNISNTAQTVIALDSPANPTANGVNLTLDADVVNAGDGGLIVPPPTSTGLLLSYYKGVTAPSNNAALLEGVIDPATATSSSIVNAGFGTTKVVTDTSVVQTDGSTIAIPTGDSYSVTGLVFLEAGHSYQFKGYHDDAIRIELGGKTMVTTTGDSYGNYGPGLSVSSGTFVAPESGYYTLEAYVHNASGIGQFSINMIVDGGTPQLLSTENFNLYSSVADIAVAGAQFSEFVGSTENVGGGYFPVAVNSGLMDSYIEISNIRATLVDNDGSEVLHSLYVSAIPVGAILTDGVHSFTATAVNGATSILDWDLNNITLLPPAGFVGEIELSVSATSRELSNGDISDPATVNVAVNVMDPNAAATGIDPDLFDATGVIRGTTGDDVINGTSGSDVLLGGLGDDTLSGGAGNDLLIGGAGNDTMTGGLGADVFKWSLADAGTEGAPAHDVITDFGNGADKLDLRDLLQGEIAEGAGANLENYLHFEKAGADTVVHISSGGGFSGGYNAGNEDQTITLQNVDLIGSFTSDHQVIQNLLDNQKLITD